ncbi:hypothetical protein TELCIR_19617 [Teladorsagia circumcincta]|uniref:Neuropeptide-like protein 31 family protein n=1 Tax=Teladorsagia circumcincta TaxID=45464 RepID=A0A2G9TLR7_TELCI|nr:hypothetical protein TELCIR_19617 [Teladorsagia circumcincta]
MAHFITMVVAVLAMLTTKIFAQWGYGFYPSYGYPMYGGYGGYGGWGGGYNPVQGAVEGALLGGMLGAMEGK